MVAALGFGALVSSFVDSLIAIDSRAACRRDDGPAISYLGVAAHLDPYDLDATVHGFALISPWRDTTCTAVRHSVKFAGAEIFVQRFE